MPLLAGAGTAVGALVLFADGIPSRPGEPGYDFVHRGPTVLWIMLVLGQTALWAALCLPLFAAVAELWRWRSPRVVAIGAVLAAVVLWAYRYGVALTDPVNPFPGHELKVPILTAIGGALALVAVFGMWCVWGAADRALELRSQKQERPWLDSVRDLAAAGDDTDPVAQYLRLRTLLQRLLALAGVIVGAAILASGALRNAVLSWTQARMPGKEIVPDEVFADELVLAYGLFVSGVLALFYAGPALRLQALGEALRDELAPPVWPPAPQWQARADERAKLSALLELEVGTTGGFRAGVAILTPLATSIVSVLLGG